jgi:diguanylate cyclase (GGDEF)-like protein
MNDQNPQQLPADSASAAEVEDRLLAGLGQALQTERERLLRTQRRVDRLRRLLAESHAGLRRCRSELAQSREASGCDALTGLPNRQGFDPPMRQLLEEHRAGREVLALLFVDLDGFKAVNDHFGHDCGDELLRIVGARLVAGMRRGDHVCRHGGDEFLCLLPHLRSATRAGELAASLLRSITQPCSVGGHAVRVGASIGVALYPRDGDSVPKLMRSADAAMYAAKSRRGGVAMARASRPMVAS